MSMENFYEIIPKVYTEDNYYNPNLDKGALKHPYRNIIAGPSGSGKTNTLMNILKRCNNYDRIYIFAKDLEEPFYQFLMDFYLNAEKRIKEEEGIDEQLIWASDKVEDIIKVDDLDKRYQNLVIFDDLVGEKDLSRVEDMFKRGRKKNASSIFITQSYFKTPSFIRQNCDYVMLRKLATKGDMTRVIADNGNEIDKEEFKRIYKEATEKDGDVLLIDKKTTHPLLKFRRNFTGVDEKLMRDYFKNKLNFSEEEIENYINSH